MFLTSKDGRGNLQKTQQIVEELLKIFPECKIVETVNWGCGISHRTRYDMMITGSLCTKTGQEIKKWIKSRRCDLCPAAAATQEGFCRARHCMRSGNHCEHSSRCHQQRTFISVEPNHNNSHLTAPYIVNVYGKDGKMMQSSLQVEKCSVVLETMDPASSGLERNRFVISRSKACSSHGTRWRKKKRGCYCTRW